LYNGLPDAASLRRWHAPLGEKVVSPALPRVGKETALFLDVDGSLLDIAPTPQSVAVPEGLHRALRRLHAALGGALALVSGRSIADLDRLFAPLRLPAAGQHGTELRRGDGAPCAVVERLACLTPIADRLRAFAAARPGLLVEDKGLSTALHFRLAPQHGNDVHRLATGIAAEYRDEIELLDLRMAVELKPRGASKRSAVEWFMREPPFLGRIPVFIGDDRTDEDGFAAVLNLSGSAVRVGLDGDSVAGTRIAAPRDVRRWLASVGTALAEG
jgi:trehalose 6-phosphate phosphatase